MPPSNLADELAKDSVVDIWTDPQPVKSGLQPVEKFSLFLLPKPFRGWVSDIAEKMQVPPEFVAVPVMVSAGAILGNRIGVRPQRHTDWTEFPNLYGCIIGRPGVMKSPAMKQAHGPLYRLEKQAEEEFSELSAEYHGKALERNIKGDVAKAEMKKRLKQDQNADVSHLLPEDDEEPTKRRHIVNDVTYQKLAELAYENPNGLLAIRDELAGLLNSLSSEDASEARGFYLTGWGGGEGYSVDRIGRGSQNIEKLTLSLMGSTQPAKIRKFIASAVEGDSNDDGLIQRFGMMVWPDMSDNWVEHDKPMDREARDAAYSTFEYLHKLTPPQSGASIDEFDNGQAYLRLDDDALEMFKPWRREAIELRVRDDSLHPALEGHIAKYRKLVPALALIHHLASGHTGPIGGEAMTASQGWAAYLESHAQRIYGAAFDQSAISAKTLCQRIKTGKLQDGFKPSDVQRKGWAGLGDKNSVRLALDILEDHGWVRAIVTQPGSEGGRPSETIRINPKVQS